MSLGSAQVAVTGAYACKRCSTRFDLPPKRRKPGRGVYCSLACKRANHVGETNPNYRGNHDRICVGCGVTYHNRRAKNRRYCSMPCYQGSVEALEHNRRVAGMGGRGARTDANHAEIVIALRQVGASVYDASPMGKGFPDLIVGFRGVNYLIEIKNPLSYYGRHGLNKLQEAFVAQWQGKVSVIRTVGEALSAIGAVVH